MRWSLVLIVISLFVIAITAIFLFINNTDNIKIDKYQVQFAYSVTSINPTIYDDWESVFIGNHIYVRLLPENDRPWISSISEKISISCQNQKLSYLSSNCKRIMINLYPKSFNDCKGRTYTVDDIRTELGMLLKAKAWVLPNWQWCSRKDSICLTSDWIPDIKRRLQNVEFRFGWSKSNLNDDVFGVGPYCLYAKWSKENEFRSGLLQPRNNNLPIIDFHVSQNRNDNFDFAIYGNKDLLTTNRINLQTHTPLGFYVITSTALAKYRMPWNTSAIKTTIKNYLIHHEVLFPKTPQFMKVGSSGNALMNTNKQKWIGNKMLHFAIPNYLPECQKLADQLNSIFSNNKDNTRAFCTDIVNYVVNRVQKNAILWDGFMVGISPIDPSRNAIKYQYFSPTAQGSWTYKYPHPEELYYQIGIGQSLVTVDKHKICSILPNPLGLGDFFISDLLTCTK